MMDHKVQHGKHQQPTFQVLVWCRLEDDGCGVETALEHWLDEAVETQEAKPNSPSLGAFLSKLIKKKKKIMVRM